MGGRRARKKQKAPAPVTGGGGREGGRGEQGGQREGKPGWSPKRKQ